jgi:hypothetical protein
MVCADENENVGDVPEKGFPLHHDKERTILMSGNMMENQGERAWTCTGSTSIPERETRSTERSASPRLWAAERN